MSKATVRRRRGGRLAAALGVLLLAGCFEEPVDRRLGLCFAARDAVLVSVVTTIAPAGSAEDNPTLQRRLAEERRSLAEGRDEWRPRFAALEASAGRIVLEEEDGEVVDLLLARADGVSVEELASRYGLSEGALKMRLMRARGRLRQRLEALRRGGPAGGA